MKCECGGKTKVTYCYSSKDKYAGIWRPKQTKNRKRICLECGATFRTVEYLREDFDKAVENEILKNRKKLCAEIFERVKVFLSLDVVNRNRFLKLLNKWAHIEVPGAAPDKSKEAR